MLWMTLYPVPHAGKALAPELILFGEADNRVLSTEYQPPMRASPIVS